MHTSQSILDNQAIQRARRIVVLIPNPDINSLVLGRKIWDLARPRRINVLFLHVAHNLDDELRAIHTMAELSAVTHDPFFHVDTMVKLDKSWLHVIRQIWLDGDLIICFANQTITEHLLWHRPISDVLEVKLHIPTYLIYAQNGHTQKKTSNGVKRNGR